MATALLSSVVLGVLELMHPVFSGGRRYTLSAAPLQLWTYGALQILKPAGLVAGLDGFSRIATHRGPIIKFVLILAAIGGAFYVRRVDDDRHDGT